ncbi:OmpA family protein [Fluviicola taffensis]|uniref:OmpA/MotB domain protein n=1 Tax=Fluviicola taffensis (strain DSM 16823 / NCIMB 13979 / RW262) TaxID=755732 RepID=F2IK32_FLUTR|nr:OmpA family protein [Fluviicola taffensis]AEA42931.1 OmpA/MotB domain protein [Fluviicola taffensis DSM 16823]
MKGLLYSLFILTPILSFSQVKATSDSLSFYFKLNSHQINFENNRNSETRTILSSLKNQSIVIRSYTDSTGSKEYNIKLAEARLEAVKRFLNKSYPGQFSIQTEVVVGEDLSQKSDAEKRRVDLLISSANSTKKATGKGRTFELGVPIKLEIQFAYGLDAMLPSSYNDIHFLIETLQADKTLFITLAGHVCCGTDSKNLSGMRAERIKQILIMEGSISSSRINAIGFGNKKPLFEDDTEIHRQANRRVEATFYKK